MGAGGGAGVPLTSVYSMMDTMVIPSDSAHYDADDIQLNHLGHMGILMHGDVVEPITAAVQRLRASDAASEQ